LEGFTTIIIQQIIIRINGIELSIRMIIQSLGIYCIYEPYSIMSEMKKYGKGNNNKIIILIMM
jgi:hypothetical protein